VRQPNIIGIKKSYVITLSVMNTQIARGTHAAILVTLIFKIAYFSRIHFCIIQGNCRTVVGGAVIDQQEFPISISLGKHALNRFLKKLFSIEEDNDA
jgi:hypothetical protein